MALKLTKKAPTTTAKATKTVEHKAKGKVISEDSTEENVAIPEEVASQVVLTEQCRVGFEASYTHNLGDYKSARVAWTLSIPCEHSEIDEVAAYASKWIDERLNQSIAEITGED